jgi:hypothetical protein
MRTKMVLRGANFGPRVHQHGLPDETREKREEIATRLAEMMARDGLGRPLFADMLTFLQAPTGMDQSRFAYPAQGD